MHIMPCNIAQPKDPKSLEELVIPERYMQASNGERFLLHDSGPGSNRFLLFGSRLSLQCLASGSDRDIYGADGTFAVVPDLFNQLYTIHALRDSTSYPCIYALLPNRTEDTYNRLFDVVRNLQPSFQPRVIMTDFERAAINSFHSRFQDAEQRGCFFHFSQAVWRKVWCL